MGLRKTLQREGVVGWWGQEGRRERKRERTHAQLTPEKDIPSL
jgi:hypothetical protein